VIGRVLRELIMVIIRNLLVLVFRGQVLSMLALTFLSMIGFELFSDNKRLVFITFFICCSQAIQLDKGRLLPFAFFILSYDHLILIILLVVLFLRTLERLIILWICKSWCLQLVWSSDCCYIFQKCYVVDWLAYNNGLILHISVLLLFGPHSIKVSVYLISLHGEELLMRNLVHVLVFKWMLIKVCLHLLQRYLHIFLIWYQLMHFLRHVVDRAVLGTVYALFLLLNLFYIDDLCRWFFMLALLLILKRLSLNSVRLTTSLFMIRAFHS